MKVPPGSGDVDVTSGSGDATSAVTLADRFSYLSPSIQDMDVRTGPVSGGTEVTITGSGFDANDTGAMKVLFGDANSNYVLCEKSRTRCFVRSPKALMAGPVHVTVKIFDAASTPGASDLFNYTEFPGIKAINFNSLQNESASVVLDGFAPDEGAPVSLTSSDPSLLIVPPVVTVNSGAAGAIFPITYIPTPRSGSVTIAASYKGSTASVNVPIVAWPPIVLDINSASLAATVTLNTPAPAGGASVTVSSSDPSIATVPSTVTVAPGTHTAQFAVTPLGNKAKPRRVVITASLAGQSASDFVDLGGKPPPPPCRGRQCE